MNPDLRNKIIERLKRSDYWTEKTHEGYGYIHRIKCHKCGHERAYTDADKPLAILCNRENNCGEQVSIFKLFPDLRTNVEKDHPPTADDPRAPARHYLKSRGLDKSLDRLEFEYRPDLGGTGRGGVSFPFTNDDGGVVWNARFFNPPGKVRTHNEAGASFLGAIWKHPGREYDPDKETFVAGSVIDALSLIEIGVQAIALYTENAKPETIDLSGYKNPVIAFDNDLAGWEGIQRFREHNHEVGAILPSCKDWNDFLVEHGEEAPAIFTKRRKTFEANTEGLDEKIRVEKLRREIDRKINELSKEYAVIMWGGKFRIMKEFIEPTHNRPDFTLSSKEDFLAFHANRMVENPETGQGKSKKVSIATLWLRAENHTDPKTGKQTGRRQYDGIVFKPPKRTGEVMTEGYYNLWQGFSIEPKQGAWDLYGRHLLENIVNGDENHFKWVLSWMARIVQEPGGERPGTAFVMRGKQGTGKGTIVTPFKHFFGDHYLHLMNQTHLTGRFNGHLKNAIVVFCDEGLWAGDKSVEGVLKGMITEPTLPVEDKGERLVTLDNHVNLFIASNNDWVIPAGLEERRFFVVETSNKYLQNKEYFSAIRKQMENGGNAALLHYLLNLDIAGVDLRTAPKTQALMEQIEHSMDPIKRWWYWCLIEGKNDRRSDVWEDFVETQELYDSFKAYTREYRASGYLPHDAQFVRRLKDLVPKAEPVRPNGGKRGYNFPDFEECRRLFVDQIGIEIDWNGI